MVGIQSSLRYLVLLVAHFSMADALQMMHELMQFGGEEENLTAQVRGSEGLARCKLKDIFPQRELRWLHCPKTGSSFKNEALSMQYVKMGRMHEPLPPNIDDATLSTYTTMLREPRSRLASAYAYIAKEGPQGGWGAGPAADIYNRIMQGKSPGNDDLLASMVGCQTRMLTGDWCMVDIPQNRSNIDLAKSRLDKFMFVGLLEEWELSMCLFNFRMTGKRFVETCQLLNTRPTAGGDRSKASYGQYDTAGYPEDHADAEVYAHAKERFNEEIAKYGITKISCASTYNGEPREAA